MTRNGNRTLSRRRFLSVTAPLPAMWLAAGGGRTPMMRDTARSKKSPAEPSYVALHASGELGRRAEELKAHYTSCSLCPRDCRVNRSLGELGICRAPAQVRVSSAFAHYGEEPPLVGTGGSGTVFLAHCGLRCVYCQNWTISIEGHGELATERQLADAMLGLQRQGCHNINFVTPTHYVPSIVAALGLAVPRGLRLPLVYNTGGYEKADILRLLDGVFDIYLPDFKYWDPEKAARLSAEAYNYPHYARDAFREIHRQVGVLVTDTRGVAVRGLMVRHLVLPGRAAGTKEVFRFIAKELSPDHYVNVMRQ
ncbi:MAG: radical SAM protein, partial [Candidatus Aminicenantes bacterium]|nr:radical SAM protein [Candidatus Aminicenantes bacterium]